MCFFSLNYISLTNWMPTSMTNITITKRISVIVPITNLLNGFAWHWAKSKEESDGVTINGLRACIICIHKFLFHLCFQAFLLPCTPFGAVAHASSLSEEIRDLCTPFAALLLVSVFSHGWASLITQNGELARRLRPPGTSQERRYWFLQMGWGEGGGGRLEQCGR